MADWENRLCDRPPPALFTSAELDDARSGAALPGDRDRPRRAAGNVCPMAAVFARQVLNHHEGFVWSARAAGVITGSDRYLDGAGAQDWKLAGVVTVAYGDGPDVSGSAAGRGGAEEIWVPTALLPRFRVS